MRHWIAGAPLLRKMKKEGILDTRARQQGSVVANSYTSLRLVTILSCTYPYVDFGIQYFQIQKILNSEIRVGIYTGWNKLPAGIFSTSSQGFRIY